MTTEEIKRHLRNGDYVKIGTLAGVSPDYARKLLHRTGAKKHGQIMKLASKVVKYNKSLGL